MKYLFFSILIFLILDLPGRAYSQDLPVKPSIIKTGTFHGISRPLRELPTLSDEDYRQMEIKARQRSLNPELENRSYPYAATAFPKGPDPAWQKEMGSSGGSRAPVNNFNGQNSTIYYPLDPNGAAGPNHYMQTINTVYAIYNKTGALVAGPTNLNLLFGSVTGANCNDGDPIVLYDEQADRWMVAEFSLCNANDRMLIAVSQTSDPTGSWYQYSFDVADVPDYEKFGIWRDGYYMGTNNGTGNDIYVFERSQMLVGGTAQMVGFNNPWRPTTIDQFMCVPPADNDGAPAPTGSPGLFMTINDDAIGGGSDQIWIYELAVNWANPAASTFTRSQQLNVLSFDSNFGTTWDNITQPGTTQKLDAIPQVIMNCPQYRNFGTYQTLLCCHTVDVDNTNHAGIRWYELRKTSGSWSIRQQGTYAPDAHSRWMGSIVLNGRDEIGLGYSISSGSVYPGIRYTGQSASEYASASGVLNITEDLIHTGANSQTGYNRWGDYTNICLDPDNDETFWYTNQYIGSSGSRETKIASFILSPLAVHANFLANNTNPAVNAQVNFTDLSAGGPTSWNWSFDPNTVIFTSGTTSSTQNPVVQFTASGVYTVTLMSSNASGTSTEIKTGYINAATPGYWTGKTSSDWNTASNWENNLVPDNATNILIPASATNSPVFAGNLTVGNQCANITLSGNVLFSITGSLTINPGCSVTISGTGTLQVGGDWNDYGTFNAGAGTLEFTGSNPSKIPGATSILNYSRTTFTKGMTAISGGTAGPTGNDAASNVSIGFTFTYLGVQYTSVRICTNGWISLNQTGGTTADNSLLFNSTVPNTTLAAWFDDLRDDNTSVVSYKTEGAAPDRVFTVEWNSIRSYSSNPYNRLNFQVRLFETTNIIEFHYGNVSGTTPNASESASIGIEDATGGSGHFIEAITGSSTTGITNLSTGTGWPTVNYRFAPPASNETFYNLTNKKTTGTLTIEPNIIVNGNLKISQ